MKGTISCGIILIVVSGLAFGDIRVDESRMDDPGGSRYLDYDINKVWMPHFGRYTDSGWTLEKHPRFIEDVNNDGKSDIVAFGESDVWVAISDGSTFLDRYRAINNFGYDQAWRVDKDPRFVADLNGDGYKDVFGYGIQGVWAAVNDKNPTNPRFIDFKLWTNRFGENDRGGFYLNQNFLRTTSDVNGDGKTDLVVFADDGIYIALSNGTGFDSPTCWINDFGTNLLWDNTKCVRLLRDINGDGYVDVLGYGIQGVWAATNNKNNKFTNFKLWTNRFGQQDRSGFYLNSNFIRTAEDVNGDKKTDLVVFADDGVYVSISNGNGFDNPLQWTTAFSTTVGGWNNTQYLRILEDVNGDGRSDIVGFGYEGMAFAMSTGRSFTHGKMWVSDFGFEQAWRITESPRYMRDVNGDGVLDVTGYGYYGVYVSESAPLYCCDETYFYDSAAAAFIQGGYFSRVHLPRILDSIVMPKRNASLCSDPNYNNLYTVGKNADGPNSWVKVSWKNQLGARVIFNANFYDITGKNPYDKQCTNGLGLSISDGQVLSPYSKFGDYDTDALLIYNKNTAAQKGRSADIVPGKNADTTGVQFAISGMRLLKDGIYVPSQPVPDTPRARCCVGLTENGHSLIFLVQNGGTDGGAPYSASLPALADALLSLGACDALNLDGSGSAQMWFKNNKIEYKSLPSDSVSGYSALLYRPVPIVFGIK